MAAWTLVGGALCAVADAQEAPFRSRFDTAVVLDEVLVRTGFDVGAFIRRVQADTTFYKSFKSMHVVPCTYRNDIRCYDADGGVTATYRSTAVQHIDRRGCRTTEFRDEQVTGDFFGAGGGYNYYTAQLYDYLFFTHTPACHETDVVAGGLGEHGGSRIEKEKWKLKQLLFNPGAKVEGVPMMGDRAAVFDESERHKYVFRIREDTLDGVACYVFKIEPKPEYAHKVVYNYLTTRFRASDYAILARDYSLSYHTLLYDFDVVMAVREEDVAGKLCPGRIEYRGNWHFFTRGRERVAFVAEMEYR
jgi:hypothetical protein